MKKLLPIVVIFSMIAGGCASLLNVKKDVALAEDIADDVAKEEFDMNLGIGPDHQQK